MRLPSRSSQVPGLWTSHLNSHIAQLQERPVSILLTRYVARHAEIDTVFPALSHGLYRAIINETSIDLPNVYCSTSMCEFPQYDTLAIFSQCKEHLESANALEDFDICTWRNDTGTEFRDPLLINVRREIERRRWRENFNSTLTCARDSSGFWFGMRINNTLRLAEQLLTSLELRPFGSSYPGQLTQTAIQQDNASEGTRAKACEYRAASDNASTTILDTTCVDMDTDMRRYLKANSTTDQFGDVDATVTKCTLLPCVKRLAASRSQADHTSLEVLNTSLAARSVTGTSEYQTSPSHVWYCAGIAAECSFMYSVPALLFLGLWIQSVMNTHQYAQYHFSGGSSDNSTSFYQRIAGQISDLFRTPSNLNATNVNGFAYGTEVYVQDYGHCDVKEPELYTRTKNLWFERGSRIFVAIAMYWKDIYTSKADAHTSTRCHHH